MTRSCFGTLHIVDAEELREAVEKIRWYHVIDLPYGIRTPGRFDPKPYLESRYGFPRTFDGQTVLDVGAWDGAFSFEAERRGAGRVLATDSFVWEGETWGSKEGFELARRALGSSIEDQNIDVLELSPERVGKFDTVLFFGVLYHMRHPMLALERIASVTRDRLILETHIDLLHMRRPAMAFYPGDELNNDPSNWIGPNPAAVAGMLRAVGFRRIEPILPSPLPVVFAKDVLKRVGGRSSLPRMSFHAWL